MGEPDKTFLIDHKSAAELENIAARWSEITAKKRGHGFGNYVGPHDLCETAALQTKRPVGLTIRVSQAAKLDPVTLAKFPRA